MQVTPSFFAASFRWNWKLCVSEWTELNDVRPFFFVEEKTVVVQSDYTHHLSNEWNIKIKIISGKWYPYTCKLPGVDSHSCVGFDCVMCCHSAMR
jgi:hypothetical protein